MSGGYFCYYDSGLDDHIEKLASEIRFGKNIYTKETLKEFQKCYEAMKLCQCYMHRVDWLLSGDDGEENFHKRLADDLQKLKKEPKIRSEVRKCKHCYYFKGKKCTYFRENSFASFADSEGKEVTCKSCQEDATECYGFLPV